MADAKISVHNLAELKNTSDDAIPNYLNSLKFKQDHRLTDTRLALGYASFLLSAACWFWDYKLGFEDTKYYTAAAVVLFMCLNGSLTLWTWLVEKGIIYVATGPSGEKIEITTSTTKNIPIYNATVVFYDAKSTVAQTIKISRPFTQWFDAAGHFIPLPFQQMFAGEVPIIGRADPLKAVTASGKVVQVDPGQAEKQETDLRSALASIKASGFDYPSSVLDDMSTNKTGKGKRKA